MKPDRGRKLVHLWGGDCETMKLLELEGEYISFLLDMEVELGLLRHVLGCNMYVRTIKDRISGERKFELDGIVEWRICQRIEQLEHLKEDVDLELGDLRRNLEPLIHHDRG